MAMEVTFGIRGKTTTQALFVQESDWEASLSDVRKIVEQQDLNVPLEYKFLTLNGNAISHPTEENLLLRDITHNIKPKSETEETEDLFPELEVKSEKKEAETKTPVLPEIWVTPLKVTYYSSNSKVDKEGNPLQEDEKTPLLQEDGTDVTGQPSSSGVPRQEPCPVCPFKSLTETLTDRRCPSPKTLLKIVFGLALIMFALLASLTLTMHVMVKAFTGVSQSPAFNDIFSKLNGGSLETLTNLQVKMSELEISSKYEIERLTTRLAELEDLYLRDLAVHKKELNMLKKQVVQNGGTFAENPEEIPIPIKEDSNFEEQPSDAKSDDRGRG